MKMRWVPTVLLLCATPIAAQVTSVPQAQDVKPTDWAFVTFGRLVERYGCVAGYPQGTYRGDRPLTRYEFAAGLQACIKPVRAAILASVGQGSEDAADLQSLQRQFAAELKTIRGRVNTLEAKVNSLESSQFSTTTKLAPQTFGGTQPAKKPKRRRKPAPAEQPAQPTPGP